MVVGLSVSWFVCLLVWFVGIYVCGFVGLLDLLAAGLLACWLNLLVDLVCRLV